MNDHTSKASLHQQYDTLFTPQEGAVRSVEASSCHFKIFSSYDYSVPLTYSNKTQVPDAQLERRTR